MQVTTAAKMPAKTKKVVQKLAEYEGKTVSQLIKDALKTYALRHCEALMAGLDSGVLNQVRGPALHELSAYRTLASLFGGDHDTVQT
jgi:predicted DNA-binding protein